MGLYHFGGYCLPRSWLKWPSCPPAREQAARPSGYFAHLCGFIWKCPEVGGEGRELENTETCLARRVLHRCRKRSAGHRSTFRGGGISGAEQQGVAWAERKRVKDAPSSRTGGPRGAGLTGPAPCFSSLRTSLRIQVSCRL